MINIKFTNPPQNRLVIFDNAGSEVLEKMVLRGLDHAVLHSRYEMFYITPQIVSCTLKNLKYMKAMRHGQTSRHLIKFLRQLLGSLYRVYLLACLQNMRPLVVITLIDNSYPFQLISRIHKDAQFIAIQNGARNRASITEYLPPVPQPGSIISMPMLICFGQFDADLFSACGHTIDKYYPRGSLKARYYKSVVSKAAPKREFDLCLISEWDEKILSGKIMPTSRQGIIVLDHFLNRYIKEEKVSLCVALRYDNKKEGKYFLNQYGDQVTLIKGNRERMTSYDAVDRSAVTVSFYSTLAREAFGWGAKVMSCNLSGDAQFDFPCPGFWSINEQNYGLFKEKLDYLRAMDDEEYRRQTKDTAAYMMNNDSRPPHEFARELVLKQLDAPFER